LVFDRCLSADTALCIDDSEISLPAFHTSSTADGKTTHYGLYCGVVGKGPCVVLAGDAFTSGRGGFVVKSLRREDEGAVTVLVWPLVPADVLTGESDLTPSRVFQSADCESYSDSEFWKLAKEHVPHPGGLPTRPPDDDSTAPWCDMQIDLSTHDVTDLPSLLPSERLRRRSAALADTPLGRAGKPVAVKSSFSGIGGLDHGFHAARAGSHRFETKIAIEMNREAVETLSANNPEIRVLHAAMGKEFSNEHVPLMTKRHGCAVGIGGPSCQPFSGANVYVERDCCYYCTATTAPLLLLRRYYSYQVGSLTSPLPGTRSSLSRTDRSQSRGSRRRRLRGSCWSKFPASRGPSSTGSYWPCF